MNIDSLKDYLGKLGDEFVTIIDVNESCVESQKFVIRTNIYDSSSAKKFIDLFSTLTNASYIFQSELKNPTK